MLQLKTSKSTTNKPNSCLHYFDKTSQTETNAFHLENMRILQQWKKVNTKRRSEHREWSTEVSFFITHPSFKPVSLSLSRSPLI